MTKPTIRVAVTGGAGQIAYSLLFRLAAGDLFGPDQPIALHILEVPDALTALEGVKMEIQDGAYHLLHSIVTTSDPLQAFFDIDYAILIGAKPRTAGMERGDLLKENSKIFSIQGKALNQVAKADAKILVVGNPCNTNCLIAMSNAPRLQRSHFHAMTRLDQNRGSFLLAQKANVPIGEISHFTIWGNHSATQVPDFAHAKYKNEPIEKYISDRHWLENEFVSQLQTRGSAIIQARGKSSAASAAQGIIDALKEIHFPVKKNHWFSSAIDSTGNPYGIADGLIFSFPCEKKENGVISIVPKLDLTDFLHTKLKITEKELLAERDLIRPLA